MQDFLDWFRSHHTLVGALGVVSIVTFVGSLLLLPVLVARLPVDYFSRVVHLRAQWRDKHPVLVWTLIVLKNGAGVLLLVAGLAMLVFPGQGLLTMMAALVLLDVPGKRALEQRVVSVPKVLAGLNWIRRRSGREPLLPPPA